MAMEMGKACMAAVGTSLLPSLWGWTRSMLGVGIGALKGLAQSVKRCAQSLGGRITSSITWSIQFMKGLSGLLICEIWIFVHYWKGGATHAVMLFKIYSKKKMISLKIKVLFFRLHAIQETHCQGEPSRRVQVFLVSNLNVVWIKRKIKFDILVL